jgi:hypothetical protein
MLTDTETDTAARPRQARAHLPPPLTATEQADIREAIAERAAIVEFDAGQPRAAAEEQARSAMRVFRYRLVERPDTWLSMLAPGCDLASARHALELRFGADRLVDVVLQEAEQESSR